jgi:hypothetical protein
VSIEEVIVELELAVTREVTKVPRISSSSSHEPYASSLHLLGPLNWDHMPAVLCALGTGDGETLDRTGKELPVNSANSPLLSDWGSR